MTKVGHGRSPPQNRHTVGSAENRSGIVLATISRGRGQRRMARPAGFEPATTRLEEIGRAHVSTPVTNAQIVCRLLHEKKKTHSNYLYVHTTSIQSTEYLRL